MAVYKVIQDVEAEDKLLGPLTLKGFIYAGIAGTCAFIIFRLVFIASPLKYLFILMFLLPMILFGVLASPLGREQPTEVWLLSRIRFMFKPRSRLWDQSGLQELVTITAPKKIERQLTKDLTPTEVQSRLKTLANTLDTRGWAVKNVDANLNIPMPQTLRPNLGSDRLVDSSGLPQDAPIVDVHASDDILDEQNNPTAKKFASMMQEADSTRKDQLKERVKKIEQGDGSTVPTDTAQAGQLTGRLAKARAKFVSEHKEEETAKKTPAPPVTVASQAVNMELAQSGSAFSVATLSSLANRQPRIEQTGPSEVTISLH